MFKRILNWIKLNKDYTGKFFHIMGLIMTWLFAFDGITKGIENKSLSLFIVILMSIIIIISAPKIAIEVDNEHQ